MAVIELPIIYYLLLFGTSKDYSERNYNTADCSAWLRNVFCSSEEITGDEDLSVNGITNNSGTE
jgi:hypothetical protein